jgi:hypothetical protein
LGLGSGHRVYREVDDIHHTDICSATPTSKNKGVSLKRKKLWQDLDRAITDDKELDLGGI